MSLYVKIPLVYFERDIIMSQWDKDYLGLCRKILEEGTEVVNRTGTNTIKSSSFWLLCYKKMLNLSKICVNC